MTVDQHAADTLDVLRATCPQVGCTALALIVPGRSPPLCWAANEDDRRFAEEQLDRLGPQLFREAVERGSGFTRNRVRLTPDGPLLCRLLGVPLHDAAGSLAGLLVGIARPDTEPFDDRALREASRAAVLLRPAFRGDADALSGLLTYSAFERLSRATLFAAEPASQACVLYGDIDQLHVVNDRLGFGAGDRIIAQVGACIRECLDEPQVLAARLSGDRFTVLLPGCTLAQGRALADRVRERVAVRHDTGAGESVGVTISWGVATFAGQQLELQHAVAAAELACKAAKDRGRNRVEVYQAADHSIVRRLDDVFMVGNLRDALDDGRLCLYAQPIVPLAESGAPPVAYELLARFVDASGRIVEPAQFMSAATRYQLLPLIDRAVVREAFRKLDAHRGRFHSTGLRFSINLSGPTLCDAGFLEWLLEQMAAMSVDGRWLSFEITETAAAADLARPQDLIRRLKSRGCHFALDDFGTGVNSLAYLKALDVDTIKLDGSYVRDMTENRRSEALVKAVAALADSMGIVTVAEYVETGAIRDHLRALGIAHGQGFALGRPEPLETLFDTPDELEPAA